MESNARCAEEWQQALSALDPLLIEEASVPDGYNDGAVRAMFDVPTARC